MYTLYTYKNCHQYSATIYKLTLGCTHWTSNKLVQHVQSAWCNCPRGWWPAKIGWNFWKMDPTASCLHSFLSLTRWCVSSGRQSGCCGGGRVVRLKSCMGPLHSNQKTNMFTGISGLAASIQVAWCCKFIVRHAIACAAFRNILYFKIEQVPAQRNLLSVNPASLCSRAQHPYHQLEITEHCKMQWYSPASFLKPL